MASLPPRPKPWETAGATSTTSTTAPSTNATAGPSKTTSAFDNALQASSGSTAAPKIPDRPAGLAESSANGALGYSGVQSYQPQRYGGSYGMSPYGGMGGSLGGYGGYGGYGGMSRFGGGYGAGGYGGYGMGGYGVGGMGGPGEGYTLTSSLQASTAPAFAVLESLVTAFTSLAQLIESTYVATHSSFFAMVGVADQLGSVKTYLGQVLGVFSVLRLGKKILAWLRGKKATVVKNGGWANEWSNGGPVGRPGTGDGGSGAGRPSAKPLVLFLLSAVGLPYLMSRLVRLLIATQQAQQAQQQQGSIMNADGTIDPTKLEFVRAKWEFKPSEEWELALARDEIVAVLEKREAGGAEGSGWWRGRTRDGRVGWFPGNYVEVIRRREPVVAGSNP
ncbi:hypothetical protein CI109_102239 [Kwoniella shandongensis]|uniref:Peroxisomal membrane protein PEX13 n=1 Tax=Kwoniella shandongensis TaxID=1734106 RepID=A0A5M6BZ19_9TREE|nr:uncharacterized protein CI109_003607 [Kwoniella shandongensis]KAA5527953.1 hypothetical protein CI109_003607 [Kwoniella shandongensis]